MKLFIKNFLGFLSIPLAIFFLLVIGYLVFDPYKIIYKYDTYTNSMTSRDYSGLEMFKRNYPKYKYDSFMFGSSRVLAFKPTTWEKYLEDGSSVYTFDAYADNIYGIYHKIKYLDSLDVSIKNAIILIDADHTFLTEKSNNELEIISLYKHPDLDNSSWCSFHIDHFLSYLRFDFIVSYYGNKFFDIKNDYVYRYIGDVRATVDSITNGLTRDDLEELLNSKENYRNSDMFYEREGKETPFPISITPKHINWLETIKAVFDKDETNYKIIIGPLYNQYVMSETDFNILKNIFGEKNIYDFSGVNSLTNNVENYYEMSHYRPHVGDSIFEYIYVTSKFNRDTVH